MSPRIIMAVLMLFFVPEQWNQNQQDCRDIEAQLSNCRGKLSGCEKQVREADVNCENRLRDLRSQLSERADARYGQLKTELAAAQSELQTLQRDYSRLKGDLTKAQNDVQASQASYDALKQDSAKSGRTIDELRSQNAQLKTSYEAQLAERQTAIDAKTREIADKNKQIAGLNSQNVTLAGQVSALGQSLKSAEQARIAADQAKTDLQANLDRLSAEERKKPEVVLRLIQDYQNKMDQSGAPVSITQGKDGSIKRELVIGTLEVKPYPAEIPAEGKLQLIAKFTPRPIGDITSNTPWYVNLVYNPPPGITAVYNQKESGEEVREVHLGYEHTWVWIVDTSKDFRAALAATEMDIRAGFQKDKVERIAGQPVILTRGKPAPGFFAVIFEAVKANLTYILATLTALLGIWGAFLTVKLKRVELAKTEKLETPSP